MFAQLQTELLEVLVCTVVGSRKRGEEVANTSLSHLDIRYVGASKT